eukprot:UN09207
MVYIICTGVGTSGPTTTTGLGLGQHHHHHHHHHHHPNPLLHAMGSAANLGNMGNSSKLLSLMHTNPPNNLGGITNNNLMNPNGTTISSLNTNNN